MEIVDQEVSYDIIVLTKLQSNRIFNSYLWQMAKAKIEESTLTTGKRHVPAVFHNFETSILYISRRGGFVDLLTG